MTWLSTYGEHLLKGAEGCRLFVYDDKTGRKLMLNDEPEGWPTIGWGHKLPKAWQETIYAKGINIVQAEEIFQVDMHTFEVGLLRLIPPGIQARMNPNQKDAIFMFAYNVGLGAFATSTDRRLLNIGLFVGVPAAMKRWNRDDWGVNEGLVKRRQQEADLFVSPCPAKLK